MSKLFPLLLCCLLSFASSSQAPPAFPDTPTITETSVGKARIGMPIARLKELYKGCTFKPTYMASYGFDGGGDKPDAITVSSGAQKLFVYFPDWQTKKKIAGLIVLHPSYKTAGGIHVGSTSGQLKSALPKVRVGPHDFVEGIEIADAGSEGKPGLQYIFYKQGTLSKNKDSVAPSEIAVTNAKISWIQIYPN